MKSNFSKNYPKYCLFIYSVIWIILAIKPLNRFVKVGCMEIVHHSKVTGAVSAVDAAPDAVDAAVDAALLEFDELEQPAKEEPTMPSAKTDARIFVEICIITLLINYF